MSTKDAILGGGVLGILGDGFLNGFDLILGTLEFLMGSVDIFYSVAILGTRLAPYLEWVDGELISKVMLFFTLLYLLHLANKLRKRIQNDRT